MNNDVIIECTITIGLHGMDQYREQETSGMHTDGSKIKQEHPHMSRLATTIRVNDRERELKAEIHVLWGCGKVSVVDPSAILNRGSNTVIRDAALSKVILLEVEGCLQSKTGVSLHTRSRQIPYLVETVAENDYNIRRTPSP